MQRYVQLVFNSVLLYIYLEAILAVLISCFYYFSVPWIVWGGLVVTLALHYARIAPPEAKVVNEILGCHPVESKDELASNSQGNAEQYCMRVVAHRGGGFDYPENSLSAFKNTKDKGCTAVEFDLALTKDNVAVIFHDSTIERLTAQLGTVREMTWDELRKHDIAYTHPLKDKFNGPEQVALFDDVLRECMENGQRVFIDIKEQSLEVVQVVINAYKKYPKLYSRAVVSSFHPIIVYMIRRKEPRIVCSLAWRPYFYSRSTYSGLEGPGIARHKNIFRQTLASVMDLLYGWALPRYVYYIVGVSAILLHKDIINHEVIQQWNKRGVRVIAWTVNLPSEKQYFSKLLKITYMTDTLLDNSF